MLITYRAPSAPQKTLHKAKGLVHATNKLSGNVSKQNTALEKKISDSILAGSFQTKSYVKSHIYTVCRFRNGEKGVKIPNWRVLSQFLLPTSSYDSQQDNTEKL